MRLPVIVLTLFIQQKPIGQTNYAITLPIVHILQIKLFSIVELEMNSTQLSSNYINSNRNDILGNNNIISISDHKECKSVDLSLS